MFKIIKKMQKLVRNRAGHVDATWHARPRGRVRWPAWQAKVTRGPDINLIVIYHIKFMGPSCIRGRIFNISNITYNI